MADDPVDPAVDPEVPAVDSAPETPPETQAAAPETPAEQPETQKPAEPVKDWKMDALTKSRSRVRDLQAELERYKAQRQEQQSEQQERPPGLTQADVERLANERARDLAAQANFNAQCDAVANAGRKAFPDFEQKIQQLVQLVDQTDAESRTNYNRFLEVAIGTGQAERLLHQLGSAPDEAARLMALPPVRMAMEMAKLATAPQPQATAAPKPINPLTNRGVSHEAIDPADPDRADKLSTEAWMARRNKQLADRSAA